MNNKQYRIGIILLLVLSLFPSRICWGSTEFVDPSNSVILPGLSRPAKPHYSYPILAYTFEDQLTATAIEKKGDTITIDQDTEKVSSLSAYGKDFFPDLRQGIGKIFSAENMPFLAVGAGVAGLAIAGDRAVKDYRDRRPPASTSRTGDLLGNQAFHAGIGAALLGAGTLTNSPKLADTGVVAIQSLFVNFIATEGLQYTIRRANPNRSNHTSFPSGRASSTAALAASISGMYDWDLKLTIPLFATVAYVGASQLNDNKHYLSDVLAGIALGTIVGTSFAGYHEEKNEDKKNNKKIALTPIFEKNIKGALFTMKW